MTNPNDGDRPTMDSGSEQQAEPMGEAYPLGQVGVRGCYTNPEGVGSEEEQF